MDKDVFRCVECNEKATELHRDYSNGILKLSICVGSLLTSGGRLFNVNVSDFALS